MKWFKILSVDNIDVKCYVKIIVILFGDMFYIFSI